MKKEELLKLASELEALSLNNFSGNTATDIFIGLNKEAEKLVDNDYVFNTINNLLKELKDYR